MDMVLTNDAEEIEALLERGYKWDGVIWWRTSPTTPRFTLSVKGA